MLEKRTALLAGLKKDIKRYTNETECATYDDHRIDPDLRAGRDAEGADHAGDHRQRGHEVSGPTVKTTTREQRRTPNVAIVFVDETNI